MIDDHCCEKAHNIILRITVDIISMVAAELGRALRGMGRARIVLTAYRNVSCTITETLHA